MFFSNYAHRTLQSPSNSSLYKFFDDQSDEDLFENSSDSSTERDQNLDSESSKMEKDFPPFLVYGDRLLPPLRKQLPEHLYHLDSYPNSTCTQLLLQAEWDLRTSLTEHVYKACIFLVRKDPDPSEPFGNTLECLKVLRNIALESVEKVYVCQPPGDNDKELYKKEFKEFYIPTNIDTELDHQWDPSKSTLSEDGSKLCATNIRFVMEYDQF